MSDGIKVFKVNEREKTDLVLSTKGYSEKCIFYPHIKKLVEKKPWFSVIIHIIHISITGKHICQLTGQCYPCEIIDVCMQGITLLMSSSSTFCGSNQKLYWYIIGCYIMLYCHIVGYEKSIKDLYY